MHHLRAADAVGHLDAGGRLPALARGVRQGFPGRHALLQAGQVIARRQRCHLPVEGGRGKDDGGAEILDQPEQRLWRQLLGQHRAGADAQRKTQHAAQPEGERDRRRAAEHVVGLRAQHVTREQVAHRQHVAMEMHGALGLAGGAAGKGDQADVVAGGVAGREGIWLARHRRLQRTLAFTVEVQRARQARAVEFAARLLVGIELLAQPRIAQRGTDLGLVDDLLQFLGAQQRHGRHRDHARLERGQPAGGHHQVVGPAQQHAAAGHQLHVLDQHMGDAVHQRRQLRIRDRLDLSVAAMADGDALAAAFAHVAV
ncbi:hypothetical protein D9M72_416480 [compost metagenome]